jgi:hypothetical protein
MDLTALNDLTWRKSSFSHPDNAECVELTFIRDTVAIRDSKDPTGSMLLVPAPAWQAACARLKR